MNTKTATPASIKHALEARNLGGLIHQWGSLDSHGIGGAELREVEEAIDSVLPVSAGQLTATALRTAYETK